ncbi:hypothetical protein SAMN04488570_0450 [Nocardioides scoriae]|uniref:Copper type II ascorbate-dependent monooxygenase, C-terminal domain n=1 Tax=Nocardioides scoriae TaxID=642780 RepID=A0A1H1M2Y1_9ACTN|nr:hypothetical protein SAMN04488570_0450 [Nocardioides scoriae]
MSRSRASRRRGLAPLLLAALLALVLAGCGADAGTDAGTDAGSHDSSVAAGTAGGTTEAPGAAPPSGSGHASGHGADTTRAAPVALRPGERRDRLAMPEDYTPRAPTGVGTDDYRCFLLDPATTRDQVITGFDVRPGNPDVVHHVILFRVPAAGVAAAEERDAATPGQGWTCFGDSGLSGAGGGGLDDAPWLGAWAPGGREQVWGRGLGVGLGEGDRVVMQVHYNLLQGAAPDRSAVDLRLADRTPQTRLLRTVLLPAPVELPCRAAHADGPLCDRAASLSDVKARFGEGPGSTADLLHLLCGELQPGPVQTCTRPVTTRETVRGVAGHMHLLGRSIEIEVDPGTPRARTLLDTRVWDFDDQGSRRVRPTVLEPGDQLRVTCRHDQELRDRLPAFEGQPDKYVVWGEGSTDEMCLGILQVTRP